MTDTTSHPELTDAVYRVIMTIHSWGVDALNSGSTLDATPDPKDQIAGGDGDGRSDSTPAAVADSTEPLLDLD